MQIGLGPFNVAIPGIPVPISTAGKVPTSSFSQRCQSILFQVLSNAGHTNTGRIYILCNGVRVATLAVPTANSIPSFSATIPNTIGGLNASIYSIDADVGGDGADVSILSP